MRVEGRERAKTSYERIPCGTFVLKIAPIPYHVPFMCGRWDCENCKKRKTDKCLKDFTASFSAPYAYVSRYPAPTTTKEIDRLSNFLDREIPGSYYTYRDDNEVIIISKSAHPGSKRIKTTTILNTLIPEILSNDWTGKPYANRATHSLIEPRNNDNIKSINQNPTYATWCGPVKAEKDAEEQFKALTDDPARAQWLFNNDSDGNLNLSMRGKELVEQYQSQTCSEPRQEVSEEEILLYANEGK